MTKEDLEKEVTRLRNENLDIINKYTRFAETDRRTIAELEAQIEKLQKEKKEIIHQEVVDMYSRFPC